MNKLDWVLILAAIAGYLFLRVLKSIERRLDEMSDELDWIKLRLGYDEEVEEEAAIVRTLENSKNAKD